LYVNIENNIFSPGCVIAALLFLNLSLQVQIIDVRTLSQFLFFFFRPFICLLLSSLDRCAFSLVFCLFRCWYGGGCCLGLHGYSLLHLRQQTNEMADETAETSKWILSEQQEREAQSDRTGRRNDASNERYNFERKNY
jgi:hypothetical protein